MTIHYLRDYASKKLDKRPREITFHAARNFSISVRVDDGDVGEILSIVIERGGIGERCSDGVYRFVPWPCELIEIKDL